MPEYLAPGVYVDEVPFGIRSISGVSTSTTAFVGTASRGPVDTPVRVGSFAEFETEYGAPTAAFPMTGIAHDYWLNGGTTAVVVRVRHGKPSAVRRGLAALDAVDRFGLLCILPPDERADTDGSVYGEAARYCRSRRAMLLVDPPRAWSTDPSSLVSAVRDDVERLRKAIEASENAALYFPRILRSDSGPGAEPAVPSGAVAGVIARTDAQHGVWSAPAGTDASLAGVEGVEVGLSDTDNDVLNSLGVNCLRSFPGVGPVVWGARTLAGADELASEWKYIPIRRLALFIEESLYRGTTWAVFEPNDEPLWARIRSSAEAFLHGLFERGAFAGETARDSYFVRCDASTMTQDDIDAGRVILVIGVAPLKPAEFVIIRIQQVSGREIDRYRSFRYRLTWMGRYVAGASEINAPSPKGWGTSSDPIELRLGVSHDGEFQEWARAGSAALPAEVIIEAYDEAGQLSKVIEVSDCRASEFQAMHDLVGTAGELTIQTLRLVRHEAE